MNKILESIMIKRLSDITEIHHMLLNTQMKAKCKWFMISALNLLVDQVHAVWDCKINYMIFMLSWNIINAFYHVLHIKSLHILKIRKILNYIIDWTCSFLKDRESSLIFNEQMSSMQWINADISQKSLIFSIFFLFFNASLIKKCKALEIKIKVLNFMNNINILIYNKIMKSNCKMLSQAHNICVKWV